jgi:hypothetical protein
MAEMLLKARRARRSDAQMESADQNSKEGGRQAVASSSWYRWSAKRSANAMIMKVEFAWPEVTNVELLATKRSSNP